jgi:multidrug efflux pump subunit AcrB
VVDPSSASTTHHGPCCDHRGRAHGRIRRQPDAGDIFPDLDLPVIYVAQPYGGMSPAQMEGFITYYYEYHFLYINGIESVESKSIQNTSLLKLTFHPGTDMSEALAQTIGYVNRARAFMPPGTVGPFVMRFDAGHGARRVSRLQERHAQSG